MIELRKNIIVKERQDSYEYNFTLNIGDLAVEEGEHNNLLLKDKETGETQFIIPAPYMFDANGVRSDNVGYEIDVNGEELEIKVVADAEFINAKERVFPITIDPQIVVKHESGSIKVIGHVQFLNNNENNNHYENVLKVRDGNEIWDADITYTVPTIQDDIVIAKKLVITVQQGYGSILINGNTYNVTGKDIDIAVNVSGSGHLKVEPTGRDASAYADFYTIGSKAPRFVFDYVDPYNMKNYEDDINPYIKSIDIANRTKCDLYVKQGAFATLFKSFEADDFILPLNITHIHKLGAGDSSYGLNWRLNLNRTLNRINSNLTNSTRYVYVDEYGDKYIFKESYYIIKNGKKESINNKTNITVDINGNLYYGDDVVYTCQSCHGYTLMTQLDNFKYCDLLEQREQEQIELEEYVQSYKNSLKDYVKANYSDGTIISELSVLTKDKFDEFVTGWSSSYVLITKNEAYQMQSLYNSSKDSNADELTKKQFEYFRQEARNNFETVKQNFNKYFTKEKELELYLLQSPINFVKDPNGIMSGFNRNGDLVCVYDSNSNAVMIEYDRDGNIQSIYDSNQKSMNFSYENNLLQSITDNKGRTVKYSYNGEKLIGVTFADGETLNFKYASNCVRTIETSEDVRIKFTVDEYKRLKEINAESAVISISKNPSIKLNSQGEKSYINKVKNILVTYEKGQTNIKDDQYNEESYKFDDEDRLTKFSLYDIVQSFSGTSYNYENIDGCKIVTTVDFSDTKQNITTKSKYNQIGLLVLKEISGEELGEYITVTRSTAYVYDLEDRLINETTTVILNNDGEIEEKKTITNYKYNAAGDIVLSESYVEGEEAISGINYTENVFDSKNNCSKTISWNSLDSSSKFYTETQHLENGQTDIEKDDLGNAYAQYEYINETPVINSVLYANGSKKAYGRNPYNYRMTSITQSTEEGEANSTEITYNHGLPIKVTSGNTALEYVYDHLGRELQVKVNGVTQLTNEYNDRYYYHQEDESCLISEKQSIINVSDNEKVKVFIDKWGKLNEEYGTFEVYEEVYINDALLYEKIYDCANNLKCVTNVTSSGKYHHHYYFDEQYNRLMSYKINIFGSVYNENILYSEDYSYYYFGSIKEINITAGDFKQKYSYFYKNTAARDLDYIEIEGYKFAPLIDVNGRNTGKEITKSGKKIAAEYTSYRKVGDHATNTPSTVWFASGNLIRDSLKYIYDAFGNIAKVFENGKLIAEYSYDAMNRIVKEVNIALDKTYEYDYDNNGNILRKSYGGSTDKYIYDGDRLLSFNDEKFIYDNLGNPTTYRNKTLRWQYGNRLLKFGETTFAYDGFGNRIKKDNIEFLYDKNGNIIKQSDGLEFIYDNEGVIGLKHNGKQYFYRKDAQGNIIAILDSTGNVVVRYVYDCWGNHAIVAENGEDIEDKHHIGNLNPFRYNSYYYDRETGLYYLKSRYYDPEICRFISQDSLEYADHKAINGINLYVYCRNNPVNNCDPTGNWSLKKFFKKVAMVVAAVVVVVAVAAVVAVTAGAAAVAIAGAVGVGASMAATIGTTVAVTAAVGGIVVGCGEIANQAMEKGAENINIGSVAVSTLGGSLDSAMIAGSIFTGPAGTAALGAGRVVTSAVTTGLYGLSEGYDAKTIGVNIGINAGLTLGASILPFLPSKSDLYTKILFKPLITGLIKGGIQLGKLFIKYSDFFN